MKTIFNFIIFLFFANVLLGQIGLTVEESTADEVALDWNQDGQKIFFPKNKISDVPQDLRNHILSDTNSNSLGKYPTNKNGELAFFCRIEVKLEKSSKIPVRFRLGEVQAVDAKEGKWSQFRNQ